MNSCKHLEASDSEVTYVPVDGRGQVDPEDVRRALRPNTRLITIMMANNETGVLQPVEEIGKVAAEADVYFHTDAVQAAGKVASTSSASVAICSPSPDTRCTLRRASELYT